MNAPIVVTELYEVAPGHEADFYSWGSALIDVLTPVDGFLGGDVRDPQWIDGEWQIVHRWADRELARHWHESSTRGRWIDAAASFSRPSLTRERPPRAPATPVDASTPAPPVPPPKWKMAVVTLIAVFPPVLLFNVTLIPRLRDVSVVLRTLVLCLGVTVVVTWVMMPRLTRLFKGWLHPAAVRDQSAVTGAAEQDAPSTPVEAFPRFRPAGEPISSRSARPQARTTRQGAQTMTLSRTKPYPRRNR